MPTVTTVITHPSADRLERHASSMSNSGTTPISVRWRVLIVNPHTSIREMIRVILDGYSDLIEVVGEASDREEAVERAKSMAIDLVLMDTQLPHSVDATRQIRQIVPSVVILGMSAEYTPYLHNAMIAVGAVAFVRMEDAADLLFRSIVFALCTYGPSHMQVTPRQAIVRHHAPSLT
jgi:DNA-binding NarL/FixJ family response regulator